MHNFIYDNQKVIFSDGDMNDYGYMDSDSNNNIHSNIIFKVINNGNTILKEKFSLLEQENTENYYKNLNEYNIYINNFKKYDLVNLNNLITRIKAQNKLNNQQIMDLLTNIYIKRYIEHMNQINAVSYKSYINYK
jgi:hypothetical protein